jgi:hypothetical protein
MLGSEGATLLGIYERFNFRMRKAVMTDATELSCFVICPIGEKLAPIGSSGRDTWEQNIQIWEEVIQPACVGAGLVPVRADQIGESGEITDQIFRNLRDSHAVIADLTGANPNVMYELGLRHATGKLTVHIGEFGRLPFDVSTFRTVQFKRTPAGLAEARRNLVEILAAGISGRFTTSAATRIWLEAPEDALVRLDGDAENSQEEEVGFLENLAELEAGRAGMIASITAASNVIQEIAGYTTKATDALNKGGANAPIATRIAISNELAMQIEDAGARLEALCVSFSESVRRSDPGTKYLIGELKKKSFDADAKTALDNMKSFFGIVLKALASTKGYRDVISGPSPTKAQGIQYRRIARALDTQLGAVPIVEEWVRLVDNASE